MNKFLKSAVDRFNKIKQSDYLINPISELDVEIIIEIQQALKKLSADDIVVILDNYKELKDEEIRDRLLQWNIDNASKQSGDKKDDEKKNWFYLKIGDLNLKSYHLIGFEAVNLEDKFFIKLNPTPEDVKSLPFYANYLIQYETEEYRNSIIEKLEKFLDDRGVKTNYF